MNVPFIWLLAAERDIHPGRRKADSPCPSACSACSPARCRVAFAGNNLRQILDVQDIDHLVLAGIATSGIVLSTALQAADLDYRVSAVT
jgi:nicotinamidase-related amidase